MTQKQDIPTDGSALTGANQNDIASGGPEYKLGAADAKRLCLAEEMIWPRNRRS